MAQYAEIEKSPLTGKPYLRDLMYERTDEIVGIHVSLNGSDGFDPNIIQNRTIVKSPISATLIYTRTVSWYL